MSPKKKSDVVLPHLDDVLYNALKELVAYSGNALQNLDPEVECRLLDAAS